MTLIIGWLACDQRGPCSAYIASDSRISDNRNVYDYSQKTFALKNTPDILGYCGETLFTYQILTRLTSMCDVGMLLSANMDYQDRSKIIFNEIKRAHLAYKLNNGVIKIYHIGRNKKGIFNANVYSWNGKIWENLKINTNFKKSIKLFSDGSGKEEYDKKLFEFPKWK